MRYVLALAQVIAVSNACGAVVSVSGLARSTTKSPDNVRIVLALLPDQASFDNAVILTTDLTQKGLYNLSKNGVQDTITGVWVVVDSPERYAIMPTFVTLDPETDGVRKAKVPEYSLIDLQDKSPTSLEQAADVQTAMTQSSLILASAGHITHDEALARMTKSANTLVQRVNDQPADADKLTLLASASAKKFTLPQLRPLREKVIFTFQNDKFDKDSFEKFVSKQEQTRNHAP